uniref:Uncharacterized protein LOC114325556 n=1 Tax=Diabrotica virgifera virgifera TaxID=50390 RepID=A0A6P7F7L9_DIAVI
MNLNDCIINQRNKSKSKSKFIITNKTDQQPRQSGDSTISVDTISSFSLLNKRSAKKSSTLHSSKTKWGSTCVSVLNSSSSRKSTSTKTTDGNPSKTIVALTEGRGTAQCEVGIAVITISNPQLVICQISDTQNYINTLTKINIFNPSEILFPNTFEHFGGNRLITKVKEQFPKIRYTAVPRSVFNKINGLEILSKLCIPSLNGVLLILQHRYYALAAAYALLSHLQDNLYVYHAAGSLKIDYQESEGYALIDVSTADRLELVFSAKPAQANKFSSLLGILDCCYTKIGKRKLRSWILQPPSRILYIEERLDCIMLQKLSSVDALLNVGTIIPDDPQKCSVRQLNYIINLNGIIDLINPLKELLVDLKQPFFVRLKRTLEDPAFKEIKEMVQEVVNDYVQPTKSQTMMHQRCFAIKPGVNELLDVVRKVFTERLNDMKDYVEGLSDKYNIPLTLGNNQKKGYHIVLNLNKSNMKNMKNSDLPNEFIEINRSTSYYTMKTPELVNISTRVDDIMEDILKMSNVIVYNMVLNIKDHIYLFHTFCDEIAQLDVYQSLAQTSLENHYIRPSFGEYTEIQLGQHPLLNFLLPSKPTANSVFCSDEYNVHIITGPNGSGKSVFIRQVMLLQIMAQLGCYVPAESAIFKPVNKMFARIYLGDNMEYSASSFVLEIKEMKYILSTMTENSLIIIDELCRSTSLEEGISLAVAILEQLARFSSYIYITTHFTTLAKLHMMYPNIKTWQMDTIAIGEDPKTFKLDYKYSVVPGITTIGRYGVYIVRKIWPDSIVDKIDNRLDVLEKEQKKSLFTSLNQKFVLKYQVESEMKYLKRRQLLSTPKIHQLLLQYEMNLNYIGALNYKTSISPSASQQCSERQNGTGSDGINNLEHDLPNIMSTQEYLQQEARLENIFTPVQNQGLRSSQYNLLSPLSEQSFPNSLRSKLSFNLDQLNMFSPIVTIHELDAYPQALETSMISNFVMPFSQEHTKFLPILTSSGYQQEQSVLQSCNPFEFKQSQNFQMQMSPQCGVTPTINQTTLSSYSLNKSLELQQHVTSLRVTGRNQLSPSPPTNVWSHSTRPLDLSSIVSVEEYESICDEFQNEMEECQSGDINTSTYKKDKSAVIQKEDRETPMFNNKMSARNTYKYYISPIVTIIEGPNDTTQSISGDEEEIHNLKCAKSDSSMDLNDKDADINVNTTKNNIKLNIVSNILLKAPNENVIDNNDVSSDDELGKVEDIHEKNYSDENLVNEFNQEEETESAALHNKIEKHFSENFEKIKLDNDQECAELLNSVNNKHTDDDLSCLTSNSPKYGNRQPSTNLHQVPSSYSPKRVNRQPMLRQVPSSNSPKPGNRQPMIPLFQSRIGLKKKNCAPKRKLKKETINNQNMDVDEDSHVIQLENKDNKSIYDEKVDLKVEKSPKLLGKVLKRIQCRRRKTLKANFNALPIKSRNNYENKTGKVDQDASNISDELIPQENINKILNRYNSNEDKDKKNKSEFFAKALSSNVSIVDQVCKSTSEDEQDKIEDNISQKIVENVDNNNSSSLTNTSPPQKIDSTGENFTPKEIININSSTSISAASKCRNLDDADDLSAESAKENNITSVSSASRKRNLDDNPNQLSTSESCDRSRKSNTSDSANRLLKEISSSPRRQIKLRNTRNNKNIVNVSSSPNTSFASKNRNLEGSGSSTSTSSAQPSAQQPKINKKFDSTGKNLPSKESNKNSSTSISAASKCRNLDDATDLSSESAKEINITSVSSASRKRNLDENPSNLSTSESCSRSVQSNTSNNANRLLNESSPSETFEIKWHNTQNDKITLNLSSSTNTSFASKKRNLDGTGGFTFTSSAQAFVQQPKVNKKFVPPRKLTAKRIKQEFEEQDRIMLESSSSKSQYTKYLEQRLNRPSVRQIQDSTHVATLRKTVRGFEVVASEAAKSKPKGTMFKTFSNENFDMTIFSDKNAKCFENFINSKETDLQFLNFNKQKEESKMPFSFSKSSEQMSTFDYFVNNSQNQGSSNQKTFKMSLTPDGYYKQHKDDMNALLKKYLNPSPVGSSSQKSVGLNFNIFGNPNLSNEDFDL